MLKSHLILLKCPSCRASTDFDVEIFSENAIHIFDGVLKCKKCAIDYPVFEGICELIPPDLQYENTWAQLSAKYELRKFRSAHEHSTQLQQVSQRQHYDHFAIDATTTYDQFERMPFWQAFDQTIVDTWKDIQSKKDGIMLDVGCGNGRSAERLMNPKLNFVGIDISRSMIKRAIERSENSGAIEHRSFFIADANNLPFKAESFDFAMTSGVLSNVPNPEVTVKSIFNQLKTGGVYFGLENNKSIFRGLFDFLMNAFAIWKNEKGNLPEISHNMLQDWSEEKNLVFQTSVYLPPHFFNFWSIGTAKKLIHQTDSFFKLIGLKNHGGLIIFNIFK